MEATPEVRDDYILNLKFHNNLPSAPSGPFLKNITITSTAEEFPEYCTSTLEKNYIWQPHFDVDLGIKLDLVDQEAILDIDQSGKLDQSDIKYLTANLDKARGKTKQIDDSNKPWWLRNTTYMENNLYNVAKVKSKAAVASETISAKRPALDYDRDMLTTGYINDSFDIVDKTVQSLIAKSNSNKLLRAMPVVPIDVAGPHEVQFIDRLHSLVRFDEDPVVVVGSNGSVDNSSSSAEIYSSSSSSTAASKRRKVDAGLITNQRQTVKSDELRNEVLEVSLVSPLATDTSLVPTNNKDIADSSNNESATNSNIRGSETLYSWVKDYRMDVQHIQVNDSFLFVMRTDDTADADSHTANGDNSCHGYVQYFPVRARVDMKKMNPEDCRPHDCVVITDQ